MKAFFQDLWYDLREKRLWPVAALLVVAVVVLPVVLSDKKEEPAPAPTASASAPEQLPTVEVSEDTGFSSSLRAFKSKDPFKPGQRSTEELSKSSSQIVASLPGADSVDAAGSAGAGSAGADAGSAESSGSTDSGGSGADSGGGSGGGGDSSPAPKTKRVSYTFVADVSFGREGAERTYRGLQRLEMLPSTDSPLLVFLGATRDGGDAVFLVDSSLSQAGEGSCADHACSVLSLGPGSEHRFKDDRGREYVLVIDRIRRVRAGSASSSRKAGASARTASGRRKSRDERRRGLVSALLVDTETVTTKAASSVKGKGR